MSFPDPLLIAGDSGNPAARIYSGTPNQAIYRKEYSNGVVNIFKTTQQVTKTRKRHLFRLEASSAPNSTTGAIDTMSITVTVDEPLASVYFTDAQIAGNWGEFKTILSDALFGKLLNGEL